MKKLVLLLAVAFSVSMFSCGANDEEANEATPATTEANEAAATATDAATEAVNAATEAVNAAADADNAPEAPADEPAPAPEA